MLDAKWILGTMLERGRHMAKFEDESGPKPPNWEEMKTSIQGPCNKERMVSEESWSVNHSSITAWRAPGQISEAQLRAQIEARGRELDLLLAEFDALQHSEPELRAQIAERRRKSGIHLV
jgi:hypothetical protein